MEGVCEVDVEEWRVEDEKGEDEGRDMMVVYLHFVQFVGPSLDGSLHK